MPLRALYLASIKPCCEAAAVLMNALAPNDLAVSKMPITVKGLMKKAQASSIGRDAGNGRAPPIALVTAYSPYVRAPMTPTFFPSKHRPTKLPPPQATTVPLPSMPNCWGPVCLFLCLHSPASVALTGAAAILTSTCPAFGTGVGTFRTSKLTFSRSLSGVSRWSARIVPGTSSRHFGERRPCLATAKISADTAPPATTIPSFLCSGVSEAEENSDNNTPTLAVPLLSAIQSGLPLASSQELCF
mmetsp:Transcript_32082/g.75295  ORF Transcript_32082/g.75295 Transcript_32082/m.75295 type:complete len:244 (+) Transcript_32082:508-1239(+)